MPEQVEERADEQDNRQDHCRGCRDGTGQHADRRELHRDAASALPAPRGLAGIAMLTSFAVAAACAAACRLGGPPLAAAVVLLVVPIGVPAAGGPFGPAFIISWYAHVGVGLPAGAALSAIRDIVYFSGNALASPLLVLCLWAAISALVLGLPPLPNRRRPGGRGQPHERTDHVQLTALLMT